MTNFTAQTAPPTAQNSEVYTTKQSTLNTNTHNILPTVVLPNITCLYTSSWLIAPIMCTNESYIDTRISRAGNNCPRQDRHLPLVRCVTLSRHGPVDAAESAILLEFLVTRDTVSTERASENKLQPPDLIGGGDERGRKSP